MLSGPGCLTLLLVLLVSRIIGRVILVVGSIIGIIILVVCLVVLVILRIIGVVIVVISVFYLLIFIALVLGLTLSILIGRGFVSLDLRVAMFLRKDRSSSYVEVLTASPRLSSGIARTGTAKTINAWPYKCSG